MFNHSATQGLIQPWSKVAWLLLPQATDYGIVHMMSFYQYEGSKSCGVTDAFTQISKKTQGKRHERVVCEAVGIKPKVK